MKKIIQMLFIATIVLIIQSCNSSKESALVPDYNGVSGSITKFTSIGTYLYALADNKILVYNISDKTNPTLISKTTLGYNIETIFSFASRLYIGATDGVFLVDVSNPMQPVLKSKVTHFVGCDPAIAKQNIAYSTVKVGIGCGGNFRSSGALNIYDVTSIENPYQLNSIYMSSPEGLAYDDNTLFVCNGQYGIEVFDITEGRNPTNIKTIENINAKDVIADNKTLIVSTTNGFSFYDYSDIENIRLIKTITKN